MENGISIYAGLGYKPKENIELIKFAAQLGMKKIFTSTQIPESGIDGDNFFFSGQPVADNYKIRAECRYKSG